MSVYRIYVEKKPQFAVEGKAVLSDLKTALQIKGIKDVRIVNRYDAEGITKENFEKATPTVFSEPPVDDVYYSLPEIEADERCSQPSFYPVSSIREQTQPLSVYRCCVRANVPQLNMQSCISLRAIFQMRILLR